LFYRYECKIFDYSQSLTYGKELWEREFLGREECGVFPQVSSVLQHLRYAAEAFIPFTIAVSFNLKKIVVKMETLRTFIKSTTKNGHASVLPQDANLAHLGASNGTI
jgi:hypothetical protein